MPPLCCSLIGGLISYLVGISISPAASRPVSSLLVMRVCARVFGRKLLAGSFWPEAFGRKLLAGSFWPGAFGRELLAGSFWPEAEGG